MEVEIKGKTYRVGRLNALNQMYVFKRISPIAIAFLGTLGNIRKFVNVSQKEETTGNDVDVELDFAELGTPVIQAFSRIPDEDVSFVMAKCLEQVMRLDGKEAHRIMVNGQIMYDDIQLIDLMHLTWLVVRDDLQNFTSGIVTRLAVL